MTAPGRLKLDFLSCGPLGPMPTTNVILPTSNGEDCHASGSFVYQEAVIGSEEPLRALVAPERFGAYLRFLMDEARTYVTESHRHATYVIKALKRILALMSAFGDHARVDTIRKTLNRPEIESVVTQVRLQELDAMRTALPDVVPSRFERQIDNLRDSASTVTSQDVQEALALARELAASLIEETEDEFAEYA